MTGPTDPEVLLDDVEPLLAADRAGLLRATALAGATVRTTARDADGRIPTGDDDPGPDRARAVVLGGHGEAASAARLLRALAPAALDAPVVVHDALEPPGWLGVGDVVLALSRTGDDEHSLRTAEQALRRGCRLHVLAPEGSPLGLLAAGTPATVRTVPPDVVDGAALWGQVAFGLGVFDRMVGHDPGEVAARASGLADVLDTLADRNGPVTPSGDNQAKTLTLDLLGATPLVVADSAVATAVANRFALRLLHCAGLPTQVVPLPGGLASVRAALRGPLAARGADLFYDPYADPFADGAGAPGRPLRVVLFAESADPAARHHLQALCEEHHARISVVAAEGTDPAYRAATLCHPADLAVCYLSLLAPTPPASDYP